MTAHYAIGETYLEGDKEKVSAKKVLYYYQLAVVGENVVGRVHLRFMAQKSGDIKRAVKHCMRSACYGKDFSLEKNRELLIQGHMTKRF